MFTGLTFLRELSECSWKALSLHRRGDQHDFLPVSQHDNGASITCLLASRVVCHIGVLLVTPARYLLDIETEDRVEESYLEVPNEVPHG